MVGDYISREAVLTVLDWDCASRDALDAIKAIPAADVVEVRHGQFLGTEFDGYADGLPVYYEWQCSECGCIFEDEEPTYKFCPWCGAKMDGGQDDGRDRR